MNSEASILKDSINQRFLNSFPKNDLKYKPKYAGDTADLHINNLQPVCFITPNKLPSDEIFWDEKKDLNLYWKNQEQLLWGILGVSSFLLFLVFYYFSLKAV